MTRLTRSLTALPLAAAVVLAACGQDHSNSPSRAAPGRLAVSAHEYALDTGGVRTLPAGAVTVSLRNTGRQDHGLQIYRLKDDSSFRHFKRALHRGGDDALSPLVSSYHGGPLNVPPGRQSRMTLSLRPGIYVLEDFGETPTGEHNARDHGMLTSVRVTGAKGPAVVPPRNATAVSLAPRGCRVPETFPRHGAVAISAHGDGVYEFVLSRVAPQDAARELRRVTDGDPETNPEGEPVDLQGPMSGGQTAYVDAELRPGAYIAMCVSGQPDGSQPKIHASTIVVR